MGTSEGTLIRVFGEAKNIEGKMEPERKTLESSLAELSLAGKDLEAPGQRVSRAGRCNQLLPTAVRTSTVAPS